MAISIDRIEEEKVVTVDENGATEIKPRELFEEGIKEGDVVVLKNGMFVSDKSSTESLRKEVNALLEKLIRDNAKR